MAGQNFPSHASVTGGRPQGVRETASRQRSQDDQHVVGRSCTKCLTHKPPQAFVIQSSGRLASWCRQCQNVARQTRYEAIYQSVVAYKLEAGCIDCGYREHPAALHFDHRPGEVKVGNVAVLMNSALSVLWAEIEKCDVRCANCHAVKTAERREAGVLDAE